MYKTYTSNGKKIYYADSREFKSPITRLASSSKLAIMSSIVYDIDKTKWKERARINCSLFENNRALGWEFSDVFKTVGTDERPDVIQLKDGTTLFGEISGDGVDLDKIEWAYSGSHIVLQNGSDVLILPHWREDEAKGRHPWSFFATRDDGSFVMGATRGSSRFTADEMREFLKSLGCTNAMINDGGGSAEFMFDGEVINEPSDYKERPVPNTLIMYEYIGEPSTDDSNKDLEVLKQVHSILDKYLEVDDGQKLVYPMDTISISAYYGNYSPFGTTTMHYGLDMTGTNSKGGDPIKQIGHGCVIYATHVPDDVGGNFVVCEYHNVYGVPKDKKVLAYYGHLYSISTYVNDFLSIKRTQNLSVVMPKGLIIGTEGQTGQVTGPHLHLGLYIVPKDYVFTTVRGLRPYSVDPTQYLWVEKHQKLGNLGDKKGLIKLFKS